MWLDRLRYYVLALVFVAVAALARLALGEVLRPTPLLVFYLAWVGAAAFGGLGPGLLATLASWLCYDFLFDPAPAQVGFDGPYAIIRMLICLAGGLGVSVVGEKMRRARIQECRQAEELEEFARSLARKKEILQAIMNGAKNSHLVYLDRDFNFIRVNEAYARTCGYLAEEMIGKNHFVLYPHAENEAIFAQVRATGVPVEFHDKPFVFPDHPERGTTYWDWTLAPVKNGSGEVEGLVFSLFETTERKRAEEALRGAHEQLQAQAEELRRSRDELEVRVRERTAALRQAYDDLSAEMEKRARAETEAGIERQRLHEVLETLPVYLILLTPDHQVPFTNRFFRQRFGDPGSRPCFDYLFGRTEPCENCESFTALQTSQSHQWEWTGPDGRDYEIYDFPFRDTDGSPLILEMGIDITERKRAEKALQEAHDELEIKVQQRTAELRESEASLTKAQAIAHLANWEFDVRTDRGRGSEELYRLLNLGPGFTRGEFTEKLHPGDRHRVVEALDATLGAGRPYSIDYRIAPRPGEVRYVHADGEVIPDEQGVPLTFFGTVQDITERKKLEEKLRRLNDLLGGQVQTQREQIRDTVDSLQAEVVRRISAEDELQERSRILEAFFQHTIAPLAFLDRNFNYMRVNQAYAHVAGKDPEYFVGKNHFAHHPQGEDRWIFEEVVRTQQPYHAYARPLQFGDEPHGRPRYWNWLLTPLLDARGQVQSLVLNLEDVTERQKAFDELEHRAWQLQKLTLELTEAEERERKRLAEILHDDLQQVLAAAKFQVGLLRSRVKTDAAAQEIAGQAKDLLVDAIAKSRSLSHELSTPALSRSDLGEAFEWLAEQMRKKHGFTVQVEMAEQIEVESEPLRVLLYKAAQELLFNVVKHAGVAEARLCVRHRDGHIRLLVSDQGRGFDPTASDSALGFGLLSIRERVGFLGGRMKIKAAPGKGSIFAVTIPDADSTAAHSPGGS